MDRSGEEDLPAKRPRRRVQSKLSFSVASQASELLSAAPPSPTLPAAEDGRSNSDSRETESKRKRNNTKKPQVGHPKETEDSNKEAKMTNSYSKKGNRILESTRPGRKTPTKKASPMKRVELSSKRRCLNSKSDHFKDCNEGNLNSQKFSDLWSEAKKAAEENLRLSAGKQTHPFFSICRTKKTLGTREIKKQENISWLALDGDYSVSLPPVHVFEIEKDGAAVPDWKKWKFVETSHPEFGGYCSMDLSPIFEGSIKSLCFEAACSKEKELNRLFVDEKMNSEDGSMCSSNPFYEPAAKEQQHSHTKMDHFGYNFSWPSAHLSGVNDQDQYRLHKGRLASYCQRSLCCPDCSLWTDKYRPEMSMEVCGNTESVKVLSNWLHSWQERAQNGRSNSITEYSDDSSYDDGSDTDELVGRDTIKNVLLITGPVGSGKSAAIYACAKEQGFKVIEVNASSLRNGAYMRQTFGGGNSLGLTHWLAEDEALQTLKQAQVLQPGTPIDARDGCDTNSNEISLRARNGENSPEKSSYSHIANKTLFLFEEVDVVFDEDHGFISAILKLAETTKRPIILTSNSKHPVLPQLLDRLILDFKAPSYNELLSLVSMVCEFEKVHVSCDLLERVIKACLGDIRRVLILIQFWCQGMGDISGKKIQFNSSPMPFDIGAVHLALPKVFPWAFPCVVSATVEEEISRTVSSVEESSVVKLISQQQIDSSETIDPSEKINTPIAPKNRKKGKLKKHSISDQTQLSDQINMLEDSFCDSDSPSTCIQRAIKHRRCLVLSSQSSDELKPLETSSLPSQEITEPSEVDQIGIFEGALSFLDESHNSGITNLFDLNTPDIFRIGDSMESSNCLEKHTEIEFLEGRDLDNKAEVGHGRESIPHCEEEASVSETWRRLRSCDDNLKSLMSNSGDAALVTRLTCGLTDLISETDIMFRNCNPLVYDNLDSTSTPCDEPDSFSWYNEHVEMVSTLARHGVCYYTMKYAADESCPGFNTNTTADLAYETLACSTNTTLLGRLLSQESSISGQGRCFKDTELNSSQSIISLGRGSEDELYRAILPIVPPRLSMVLRGAAFHEYLSSIARISRSECSRLAELSVDNPKRRSRTSLHYLCSGTHELSLEQAALLARRCSFKREELLEVKTNR